MIIPTRNRPLLLRRAITSALTAGIAESRIIVVDDCSTDQGLGDVTNDFRKLRLIPLDRQGGPSHARNTGLLSVHSNFALLLDDDDTLHPNALAVIQASLASLPGREQYPVFQFCRSNGSARGDFFVASLADYVHERITGDFAHVIQTALFRKLGLAFPPTIIGGESQLWFSVAKLVGIPTWNAIVMNLNTDAPSRLCSLTSQLDRPREYAISLERTLEEFGADLVAISPKFYRHKKAGTAIYWLLAGDRGPALRHARELYDQGYPLTSAGIAACATMPTPLLRRVFSSYRRDLPH